MVGKTSTGFEVTIDDDVFDDIELVEQLAVIDGGDRAQFPLVLERVLGKEQKKALYDHLRNEKGRVSIAAAMQAFGEIFESVGATGKN